MKYFGTSVKYLFKNFFAVLIFTLPASLFYAFLLKPISVNFLKNYKELTVRNFGSITGGLFDFSLDYVFLSITFFVIVVFSFALLTALIEYHLRTGRLSLKMAFHQCGKYVLTTLVVFAVLALLNVFIMFIFASLAYFVHVMFGAAGGEITTTGYNVVALIYILINLSYFAVCVFLAMAIMSSVITTNSLRVSLSRTAYLFEGNFLAYFLVMAFLIIICFASLLVIGEFFLSELAAAVVFAVLAGFFAILNTITFFGLSKLERKDNIKSFFKR